MMMLVASRRTILWDELERRRVDSDNTWMWNSRNNLRQRKSRVVHEKTTMQEWSASNLHMNEISILNFLLVDFIAPNSACESIQSHWNSLRAGKILLRPFSFLYYAARHSPQRDTLTTNIKAKKSKPETCAQTYEKQNQKKKAKTYPIIELCAVNWCLWNAVCMPMMR